MHTTVLLEYFCWWKTIANEPNQRKVYPLQTKTCVLARIVCRLFTLGFANFIVANWSTIAKFVWCSQNNTVYMYQHIMIATLTRMHKVQSECIYPLYSGSNVKHPDLRAHLIGDTLNLQQCGEAVKATLIVCNTLDGLVIVHVQSLWKMVNIWELQQYVFSILDDMIVTV